MRATWSSSSLVPMSLRQVCQGNGIQPVMMVIFTMP